MKTKALSEIYEETAAAFLQAGNPTPTHCDVRCAINDALDAYDKDGYRVSFGYNQDRAYKSVLANILLLHRRGEPTPYQPKTGQRCHCRPGIERDNCPACEGTGWRIDFAAIRARHS